MDPDPGKEIVLTYLEFGVRSTGTGAKAWALRSSRDGYASDLAVGAIEIGSWALLKSAPVSFAGGVGKTATFRLYFYNATGGTSLNTRLDDIKIRTGKSTPEPKIRLNTRELDFITAAGAHYTEDFTVQGLLLEQNISITSTNPKFVVDKPSISHTAANAGAQTVNVTFDGSADATGKIVVKTTAGGMELSDTVKLTGATTTGSYIDVSIPRAAAFYLEYTPVLVGGLTTQMIELSGKSLTDSISVILPNHSAFTASAGKMSRKADREYVFIYYRPVREEVVNDTVVLRSLGAVDVRIPLRAQAVSVRTDLLPPLSYYDAAKQKTGAALKTALYHTIKNHAIVSYDSAWGAFAWIDVRPECDLYLSAAAVWDIYTDRPGCMPDNSRCTPNFQNPPGTACTGFKALHLGLDQTGSSGGSLEGVTYEREHTFPKGWWAAAKNGSGAYRATSPMYCDLFHLYPCDHRVNNLRNDNPYGEVKAPTTTFNNGSKLGPNTAGGTFTGAAYEPIDEYKGDIARNYFYMVTRYENTVQHWSKNITWGGARYDSVIAIAPGLHGNASPMIDTNSYPVFKPWAHQMLLKWHRLDPVSEKEQQRNQSIYASYQHNRNPFIDHPEMVEYIWGDSVGKPWPPAADSTFRLVNSSVTYADGAFTARTEALHAKGGVKRAVCFVGATEGDTSQLSYPLSHVSGGIYQATFTPQVAQTTYYFTIVVEDSASSVSSRHAYTMSQPPAPDSALRLVNSTVTYAAGAFTARTEALHAKGGVKRAVCFVGATEGDTSQLSYPLSHVSGGIYRATFTPALSLTTYHFTIVVEDSASSASSRHSYTMPTPPLPLSITLDTVIFANGAFEAAAQVHNAQQGVASVTLYLGATAGDTTLANYPLSYKNGAYRVKFVPTFPAVTLHFKLVAYDKGGRRATCSYAYSETPTGDKSKEQTLGVSLYPNPNGGEFSLVLPNGATPSAVEVFSVDGVQYPCTDMGVGRYKVDAPRGMYFVRITTGAGMVVKKMQLQ
jgi:endonuclease I